MALGIKKAPHPCIIGYISYNYLLLFTIHLSSWHITNVQQNFCQNKLPVWLNVSVSVLLMTREHCMVVWLISLSPGTQVLEDTLEVILNQERSCPGDIGQCLETWFGCHTERGCATSTQSAGARDVGNL